MLTYEIQKLHRVHESILCHTWKEEGRGEAKSCRLPSKAMAASPSSRIRIGSEHRHPDVSAMAWRMENKFPTPWEGCVRMWIDDYQQIVTCTRPCPWGPKCLIMVLATLADFICPHRHWTSALSPCREWHARLHACPIVWVTQRTQSPRFIRLVFLSKTPSGVSHSVYPSYVLSLSCSNCFILPYLQPYQITILYCLFASTFLLFPFQWA